MTADPDQPVTLINIFTVPVEESDRFLDRWADNARVMAHRSGFHGADMFQALDDGVEVRFVNVARWESHAALRQAQADPDFQESVRRIVDDPELHVTARPAAYSVARHVDPAP